MSLKKCMCVILLFGISSVPSNAQEGGSSVHGGSSIVCRGPEGNIISAQIKDLVKPRSEGMNLLPENTPDEMLIQNAIMQLKRVNPPFAFRVESMIAEVRTMLVFTPWTDPIDVIQDYGDLPGPLPKNCAIEQLGIFHDGLIVVHPPIYTKLLPIDRAAFLLHEAIYALQRAFEGWGIDSTKTQRLVALLLSVNPSPSVLNTAISALSFPFESGVYQILNPSFSNGCQLLVQLIQENHSELVVILQSDRRNVSPTQCPYEGQRKTLRLDPRSGNYVNSESGWRIQFYRGKKITFSGAPDIGTMFYLNGSI